MGRMYRPVELIVMDNKIVSVSIVDTGADETVISERLAKKINVELYGTFRAICASDTVLEGKYADIEIKDIWSNKKANLVVGVSDVPFNTDDIDDEGIDVILGTDFIQKTKLEITL